MPHHTVLPGVVIGAMSSGSYLFAELSATTTVPLGQAVGGFIFVAGLVWYVARKIQSVEDGQEASKRAVEAIANDVKELKKDLAKRPCQFNGNCAANE